MLDVTDIIRALHDISEQLRDASVALLTEAVTSGAQSRPPEDKVLAQAVRSVDKAVAVLQRL